MKIEMELINPREDYEDVLGFTRQTAVLLRGMGATELVPQFKERNISTEVLADLTVDDLKLLGADSELANRMQRELTTISKRTRKLIPTPQQRADQLFQALTNNNKQLSLIHAFVTYARLRINKERIDSFVQKNNTLRSSKALEIAAAATICEIREARLAIEELKLLLEVGSSSSNFGFCIAVLSGVGLTTFVILKKFI